LFEAALAVFWITSFAGMASYVQMIAFFVGVLNDYSYTDTFGSQQGQDIPDVAKTSQTSFNCCIAIAVSGAILL